MHVSLFTFGTITYCSFSDNIGSKSYKVYCSLQFRSFSFLFFFFSLYYYFLSLLFSPFFLFSFFIPNDERRSTPLCTIKSLMSEKTSWAVVGRGKEGSAAGDGWVCGVGRRGFDVGTGGWGEGVKVPGDRNDSIWNPGSAISFFFCPFLPPPRVSTSSSFFIAVFPHKSGPA